MQRLLFLLVLNYSAVGLATTTDWPCWQTVLAPSQSGPLPPRISLSEARKADAGFSALSKLPGIYSIPGYAASNKTIAVQTGLRNGMVKLKEVTSNLRSDYVVITAAGFPQLISTNHFRSQALADLDPRLLTSSQHQTLTAIASHDPNEFIRQQAMSILELAEAFRQTGQRIDILDF